MKSIFFNVYLVGLSLIYVSFVMPNVLLQSTMKRLFIDANKTKRTFRDYRCNLPTCDQVEVFKILPDGEKLIEHVKVSIKYAEENHSKLSNEILQIDGMSSSKVRHFLNNLCSLPESHYLEIGVFRGSTFVSALYQNHKSIHEATAVDNWAEFGNNSTDFLCNTSRYLSQINFRFFECDSFSLDIKGRFAKKINIYFYDGAHTEEAQMNAFTYYNDIFTDHFIAVIDDWNHEQTRKGTFQAFEKLNYSILFEMELPALYNGDRDNWWDGFYVAVISKYKNWWFSEKQMFMWM